MVLLTMTSAIVEALEALDRAEQDTLQPDGPLRPDCNDDLHEENLDNVSEQGAKVVSHAAPLTKDLAEGTTSKSRPQDAQDLGRGQDDVGVSETGEPSLLKIGLGNPISHRQIIDLSRKMISRSLVPSKLDVLLRGSRLYVAPRPPKAEPTSEYKALMARLRREEESRTYERMINPRPPLETFSQRFPAASAANAFNASHMNTLDPEDDEVTYADVNRQIAVIFNVIVSIVACAGAIWMAAQWWKTPARLAVSFGGGILVGVAEVVVYAGYIRRVAEAKDEAKKLKEVKEVVNTWTVGGGAKDRSEDSVISAKEHHLNDNNLRKRRANVP